MFKKYLFFTSLLMIPLSSNWFSLWAVLELNLFSLILFLESSGGGSMEMIIKYFFIQSINSFILVWAIFSNLSKSVICFVFLLKMGCPPMHYWLVNLFSFFSPLMCYLILTWVKLPYFGVLFQMKFLFVKFIYFFVLMGGLVGCLGGVLSSQMSFIFLFSSFVHLSWFILVLSVSFIFFIYYFLFYAFLMKSLIYMSWSTFSSVFPQKISFGFLVFMSMMMGVPPFGVFLMKWISLGVLSASILVLAGMIVFSIMSILFYFRFFVFANLVGTEHSNQFSPQSFLLKFLPSLIFFPLGFLLI